MKRITLSFRVRVTLIFAAMTFLIVGTMSLVLYHHFHRKSQDSIYSAIDMAISVNASEIKSLMDNISLALDLIHDNDNGYLLNNAEQPELASLVHNYERLPDESNFYTMSVSLSSVEEQMSSLFLYCFGSKEMKYSYKAYIEDHYPINHVLADKIELTSSTNGVLSDTEVKREGWYQKTLSLTGDAYWFTMPDKPGYLFMAKQLIYTYVDKLVAYEESFGVIALFFDVGWITRRIDTAAVTANAGIWLLDNQDQLLYTSDSPVAEQFTSYGELTEGRTEIYDISGQEYLLHKTQLNNELYMVTVVPSKDVASMTFDMVSTILIVAVAMIFVGVLISLMLSVYIVKPIGHLAGHMKRGELKPIPYAYKEKDEVSALYHSFNHLIEHVRKLMDDIVDASEKKKRAELHALQAQINPHFIYNTLNSISSVELLNGRKEIAWVISSLSQMIRYNIKDPDSMVAVVDEVRIIQCYANIQSFCYRAMIQFACEVAPETEAFQIPKVIIQPLVENAVIHGTNLLDQKVRLCVYQQDEFVCIQVWDNGTDADVTWINEYIRGREILQRTTDSLGIRNVYKRIRMVYGDTADLLYSRDKEGCTVATIYLPIKA